MIYELRQYTPNPGKEIVMAERFLKTLPLFKRHGLTTVAAFHPVEDARQLWYLLSFESESSRDASWAAFLADPAWLKIKQQSEADGPVLEGIKKFVLTGDEAVAQALYADRTTTQ